MKLKFNIYPILVSLAVVIVSIIIFQHAQSGRYVEPESFTHILQEDVPIMYPLQGSLKKGEKVSVLATSGNYIWVETSTGARGLINIKDYNKCPTTKHKVDIINGDYVMAKDVFHDKFLGKNFNEIDKAYRKTLYFSERPSKGNTVEIGMDYRLYDTKTWKSYRPYVVFVDGIATEINYSKRKSTNRLLLRFSPFASKILRSSFVNDLVSKPQVLEQPKFNGNKFQRAVSAVMRLIHALLYMILVPFIPNFLIIALLRLRYPLFFMPNWCVSILMFLTGLVSSYVWFVICLLEAYPWWFMIFALIFSAAQTLVLVLEFDNSRCEKCKSMGTLHMISGTMTGKYKDTTRDWEKTNLGTYYKNINGTIITREIRERDDEVLSETSKDGVIGVEETTVYEHNKVEREYEVKTYKRVYKCAVCGHLKDIHGSERKLLSTKILETHTTTSRGVEYYYKRDDR